VSDSTTNPPDSLRPLLLCYDGSEDASAAIRGAATLFGHRSAIVLTVWEPAAAWDPHDPATILSAPLDRLAQRALDMDEVLEEVARETLASGMTVASEAGFRVEGELARGKAWPTICRCAGELDAAAIVMGARGLSRVQSVLLGSVSLSVLTHAGRPVLVIPHVDPKAGAEP
jgi:nucleotide-binding universal stress UspA family protein